MKQSLLIRYYFFFSSDTSGHQVSDSVGIEEALSSSRESFPKIRVWWIFSLLDFRCKQRSKCCVNNAASGKTRS
mgnify:CR=1 FL=1